MEMVKKILNTRFWLLLIGIAPLTSMTGLIDISAQATESWSAAPLTEREMRIATAGETIWLGHALLFGVVTIAMAFLLSRSARAKFTAVSAMAVLVFVTPAFAFSDYGEPIAFGGVTLAIFIIAHLVTCLAGILHWKDQ